MSFKKTLAQILLLSTILAVTTFTSAAIPSKTLSATVGTPVRPLLAWTVADDGALFVLDATYSLFQLAPDSLAPLAKSSPLVPAMGSYSTPPGVGPRTLISLVADETRLFVGGEMLTQTLVLDRNTFDRITTLDKTGIMAVDPRKQLFMIAYAQIPEEDRAGKALWAYDLDNLSQAPQSVILPPMTPYSRSGPIGLVMAPESRQLYVQYLSTPGTSPRDSVSVGIYNTDPLTKTGSMYDDSRGFAFLSRPAIAEQSDRAFSVAVYRTTVGRLLIFDQRGELLDSAETFDGLPATDANGDWIYILQERGLWVLRGRDLSLQSVLPFTTEPPADLLLSPDGQTLYLLGNGWLTALPVAELHTLGILPVGPFPQTWEKPALYDLTGPEADGIQFAYIGSELYRSDDGGHTWNLLPAFTYPEYVAVESISVSPDYTSDGTLVVQSHKLVYRSTDGGNTLEEWTPRIAFTSDRDGNREIYTMDSEGSGLQRVTDHPASDEFPAWSPAWTRIAFQSDRNGNWDIYSIRADCDPTQPDAATRCDLRQLTDDPGDDTLPAWSPDGRFIAFVSTRDGNPEIYAMNSDGQEQIRLTNNEVGDWSPAWLSNGKAFVFTSDRSGNNDLYLMDVPDFQRVSLRAQLTTDPADDRDPATGPGPDTNILFLSDRDGLMRTYEFWLDYVFDSYKADQAQAHPSWGGRDALGERQVIVAQEDDGISNIYKTEKNYDSSVEYFPLTDTRFFDGHPAGSPVWWYPDF